MLRCGNCRGACRNLLCRYGKGRTHTGVQHLLQFCTTCLRQHHSRRGHQPPARGPLSGPCRHRGRGRPHTPRSIRPAKPACHSQSDHRLSHERNGITAPHVHCHRMSGRSICNKVSARQRRNATMALSSGSRGNRQGSLGQRGKSICQCQAGHSHTEPRSHRKHRTGGNSQNLWQRRGHSPAGTL